MKAKRANLRKFIEQARSDLDHYKHPNVSEVQDRLDGIIQAGQLGGIGNDRLESLYFNRGMLHVTTSYSVRCCEQTASFEIPESVIDAKDPLQAMREWAKGKRIEKARGEVDRAERALNAAKQRLANEEATQ